ncbi:MAG: GP88 family protein, partial [Pirellulales bacterium]
NTQHRCYSASQEAQYPAVYNKRAENLKVLSRAKTEEEIYAILSENLPLDAGVVRGGGSGDFFSIEYFRAFIRLARENPTVLFYAYTKCLSFWVDNREEVEALENVVMTASRGGLEDHLIDQHALREALVVLSADESEYVGELDHTDIHAADPARRNESFRLLIHGSQPKGSEASRALQILKTA